MRCLLPRRDCKGVGVVLWGRSGLGVVERDS